MPVWFAFLIGRGTPSVWQELGVQQRLGSAERRSAGSRSVSQQVGAQWQTSWSRMAWRGMPCHNGKDMEIVRDSFKAAPKQN
jgi:hypothetical protein